jgi:hypothetical protein
LGGLILIWAIIQIVRIAKWRKKDADIIEELIELQKNAGMDGQEKIMKYANALRGSSGIGRVIYKYVLCHNDFSQILASYTKEEYVRVAGRGPFILYFDPTLILLNAWLCFVAVLGGTIPLTFMVALQLMWMPLAVFGIKVLFAIILIIYRAMSSRYRRNLLAELCENATAFFNPIEPMFCTFARVTKEAVEVSEKQMKRIERLIQQDGLCITSIKCNIERMFDEMQGGAAKPPVNSEELIVNSEGGEETTPSGVASVEETTPPAAQAPLLKEGEFARVAVESVEDAWGEGVAEPPVISEEIIVNSVVEPTTYPAPDGAPLSMKGEPAMQNVGSFAEPIVVEEPPRVVEEPKIVARVEEIASPYVPPIVTPPPVMAPPPYVAPSYVAPQVAAPQPCPIVAQHGTMPNIVINVPQASHGMAAPQQNGYGGHSDEVVMQLLEEMREELRAVREANEKRAAAPAKKPTSTAGRTTIRPRTGTVRVRR